MISSQYIKKLAENAGFDLCGITPCKHLAENESYFREWLAKGYGSSLEYLERNLDKRFDVRHLVEGAQTVVVCAVSYKNPLGEGYPPGAAQKSPPTPATATTTPSSRGCWARCSKPCAGNTRAHGPHVRRYGSAAGKTTGRRSGSGLDRAGNPWLLTPQYGSYVLLGELVLTLPSDQYDAPFAGARCGRCRNCLDSCPTGAIVAPKVIDTNRCISCRTIEKESDSALPDLDGWIFGCDRCQSCCPHNQKAPMHRSPHFDPLFDPLTISDREWLAMSEEEFLLRFGNTPLARSGLRRIQQNVRINQEKNEE